jgi:hypothetical protein
MTISKCPFCKSKDVDILYGWQCYYVKCDDCGSEGSACNSEEESIEAWNQSKAKEPMKDHEFREEVNALKQLVLNYATTDQLRGRLADFLQAFKEKCGE